MSKHRHLRRSDLFLLRLWAEEGRGRQGALVWRGKLQRVVDGESHQFDDLQHMLDLLAAMLAEQREGSERDC